MSLVRLVARPMMSVVFIIQGAKTLLTPDKYVPRAKPVTDRLAPLVERVAPQFPTDTRTLVQLNGAVQLGAGLLFATGRAPRLASLALFGTLLPSTLAGHAFWTVDDPEQRAAQRVQFQKNLCMGGGLLLAGVDTAGQPGITWRTKHATKHAAGDAKRVAKRAKREAAMAKREARLAARATKAEVARAAHDVIR